MISNINVILGFMVERRWGQVGFRNIVIDSSIVTILTSYVYICSYVYMELFIMIVYTLQFCKISAYNIHVCETTVDQDQQRL